MGHTMESPSDVETICKSLIDTIVNIAMRETTVRSGSIDEAFGSTKEKTCTSESGGEILVLNEPLPKECIHPGEFLNFQLDDTCSSSFVDKYIHESSLSALSQQGEGDFQPCAVREATAFHKLISNPELYLHSEVRSCKGMSTSLNEDHASREDLLESLQKRFCNITFDNENLTDWEEEIKAQEGFDSENLEFSGYTEEPDDSIYGQGISHCFRNVSENYLCTLETKISDEQILSDSEENDKISGDVIDYCWQPHIGSQQKPEEDIQDQNLSKDYSYTDHTLSDGIILSDSGEKETISENLGNACLEPYREILQKLEEDIKNLKSFSYTTETQTSDESVLSNFERNEKICENLVNDCLEPPRENMQKVEEDIKNQHLNKEISYTVQAQMSDENQFSGSEENEKISGNLVNSCLEPNRGNLQEPEEKIKCQNINSSYSNIIHTQTSDESLLSGSEENDKISGNLDCCGTASWKSAESLGGNLQKPEEDIQNQFLMKMKNCSDSEESINNKTIFPHSPKFYKFSNTQYIPEMFNNLPPNYRTLVDESYEVYRLGVCNDEETQELLSESSEELVTVDGETGLLTADDFHRSVNPLICSIRPSSMVLSPNSFQKPQMANSETSVKESSKMEVKADVELIKLPNWEEAFEVQVQVTEPERKSNVQNDENLKDSDDDIIQTRKYWSNVGLMTENKVNRKYLGSTPDILGIESIKGITLLDDSVSRNEPVVSVKNPQTTDDNISTSSGNEIQIEDKISYLSISHKIVKKTKKERFVARLTRAVSCMFSPKRKYKQKK